jgi:hypothetical protein
MVARPRRQPLFANFVVPGSIARDKKSDTKSKIKNENNRS